MQFLQNTFVCLATGAEDVCMCAIGCLNFVCVNAYVALMVSYAYTGVSTHEYD